MDKYHYERQTKIKQIFMWRDAINADFDGYTIAASLIKNYKLLKNSVTDRRLLITNIHASVIEHRPIEAKSRKLMPTSIVV